MAEKKLANNPFLTVTGANIQTESDLRGYGPSRRNTYILHYILRGSGYYEVDKNVYYITANQSFIIYPGETVAYYPDPNDPWVYGWVDFLGTEAERLLSFISFSKSNRVAPAIDSNRILPLLRCVVPPNGNHALDCSNSGYLYVLLSVYMNVFPGKTKGVSDALKAVADYVATAYASPALTVEGISKEFSKSRSQLYRDFKQGFGMSPTRYITQFRVMKALELMRSGESSVKNIAFLTGFEDQLYFSKVFKKITGMSPAAYKREFVQKQGEKK